jgi:hypothetical protein
MLTKFHKVLIGVLAVQIVLAVVLFARGGETTSIKETPLLPGFDVSKVTRMQVTPLGDKTIDLVKKGSSWVVASSFDYPADQTKIDAVLGPIGKLSALEPIATQPARHKQLKVADDEYERKIVLTADGKDTTLFVGTPAGLRRNAIRIGGSDNVYAVAGISSFSAPAAPHMWVDAHYIQIPKEQIAKVTVKRGAQTLEFTHADDGAWTATVDGGPLDQVDSDAIDHLVDQAANVNLLSPADPKRDASAPVAVISIDLKTKPGESGAPIAIDVVADADRYWVHQRALDRAVTIDKTALELPTVEKAKLVKAPPPAAGSGSAVPAPKK